MGLVLSAPAHAQVNDKGTIHASIGIALGAHATEYEQTFRVFGVPFTSKEKDGAATVTVPIELGVGITKGFSLGLYLEPGAYLDSSATESNAIASFGLQPRFYLVNKDRFAWVASLQLGLTSLRIDRNEPGVQSSARYAGGQFGLGTGAIFQFSDLVGLQVFLRYMGNNLPLRDYELNGQSLSLNDFDATLRTSGVLLQTSLAFRF
jgi:hypothetical protein